MAEAIGEGLGGRWGRAAWGLAVALAVFGSTRPARGESGTSVVLSEAMLRGSTTRVRIELKAQGLFRPGLPPGKVATGARMPQPLALDVQTRLIFSERVLELAEEGTPSAIQTGEPGA